MTDQRPFVDSGRQATPVSTATALDLVERDGAALVLVQQTALLPSDPDAEVKEQPDSNRSVFVPRSVVTIIEVFAGPESLCGHKLVLADARSVFQRATPDGRLVVLLRPDEHGSWETHPEHWRLQLA